MGPPNQSANTTAGDHVYTLVCSSSIGDASPDRPKAVGRFLVGLTFTPRPFAFFINSRSSEAIRGLPSRSFGNRVVCFIRADRDYLRYFQRLEGRCTVAWKRNWI
jgi:hypothetical protein